MGYIGKLIEKSFTKELSNFLDDLFPTKNEKREDVFERKIDEWFSEKRSVMFYEKPIRKRK